ncbi:butyrate kinase [bacterium]|nr:butyrate kinase [bacterium]
MYRILVINPGSTSTKAALYSDSHPVWTDSISYSSECLAGFPGILAQFDMRWNDLLKLLDRKQTAVSGLDAVVARGGPFKPLQGGVYRVSGACLDDVKNGRVQADHISNIGVILADALAGESGVPAYFVDPVSVDEMSDMARLTGLPEIRRISLAHALNIRAVGRKAAALLDTAMEDLDLVIAHLGGGISVCAMKQGRMLDVTNANEEAPFSPERAGTLPSGQLVRMCFSGKYSQAGIMRKLTREGGLVAHLGTSDLRLIVKKIEAGDGHAQAVLQAMAFQIGKTIASMAAMLCRLPDAVVLTGGGVHCGPLVSGIRKHVDFMGPVLLFPGENEMEALALGALAVLRGEEKEREYPA